MKSSLNDQKIIEKSTNLVTATRVIEARQAMGLSVKNLADLLGLDRQTIYGYESGEHPVPSDTLVRISELLNQPLSFFKSTAVQWDFEKDVLFFRDCKKASDNQRFQAGVRLKWLQEYFGYLTKKVEVPEINVPDLQPPSDPSQITAAFVESAALSVRIAWKLGLEPVPNVVRVMERNGIIIGKIDLDIEDLDGVSSWSSAFNRPFVLLNGDKASAVRSRFDAAHELGHIILHRNIRPEYADRKQEFYKLMEKQAHRFAGAFLMPEAAWRSECRVVSMARFKGLKPRWLASIASMLSRSLDLDLISKERFVMMRRQFSNNVWRQKEPFDDIIPAEKPLLFSQASELLLKHGYFIPEEFALRSENLSEITGLDPKVLNRETLPIMFN
jgi:Zn-dependent peptidase ImmA (M78 family)/DNA-binding XRE family transcriptional regulator